LTSIDPWFLNQIAQVVELDASLRKVTLDTVTEAELRQPSLRYLRRPNWRGTGTPRAEVREKRKTTAVRAVFNRRRHLRRRI